MSLHMRKHLRSLLVCLKTKRGKQALKFDTATMPVIVLLKKPSAGNQPDIIPISQISSGKNHGHHSVEGRVVHKGPLVSSSNYHFILKGVIEEDNSKPEEKSSINIIMMGMLAKEFSQAVNIGDLVVASGFMVGKSPTARQDKRHVCNLMLSGDKALIHVCRHSPCDLPPPGQAEMKKPSPPPVVLTTPKYTYVKLRDLKAGQVFNVYGVVLFFKQPFKSRGTDFFSSLKITDQSEQKIRCTLFCSRMESHPQIFQSGDIVRLHRVKAQSFNDSLTLINTFGFSALTFDGTMDADTEPRSSSKTFHFTEEDRRTVTELRSWAASRNLVSQDLSIRLANAQPKMYFNLTCQLLAKAPIDATCTLLRVWDGTQCPHALLKVTVDANIIEGITSFSEEREKLIANVLVFDNHVQSTEHLKPGDFLRIFNVRAIPGSIKRPGLSSNQVEQSHHLSFHLHGGTTYGRGIRILPDNCPDVQELRRIMDVVHESIEINQPEVNDSVLWHAWNTPPQSPNKVNEASVGFTTERTCGHGLQPVSVSELKVCKPGGYHHVKAQLRSYEPLRLHRALKLFCSKCKSMQDVPDNRLVTKVFSDASNGASGLSNSPPWSLSGKVHLPGYLQAGGEGRTLNVHLSAQLVSEGRTKELIFLSGCTPDEACHLAATYANVIPVRPLPGDQLDFLDLTVPFLFRGSKRFYGCKQCSKGAVVREPKADGDKVLDEQNIAEVFGIQLLKFVMLLTFYLQDASGMLKVFLLREAEDFFNVSADEAATQQEAQDRITRTLNYFCPPEGRTSKRPWLDFCLAAYRTNADNNHQDYYQITNTRTREL
ncbi:protection of telomeres protein 1 [Stigmatopora argus]